MPWTHFVLFVYHLFLTCEEISFQDLKQQLRANEKTFLRNHRLLERAVVLHHSRLLWAGHISTNKVLIGGTEMTYVMNNLSNRIIAKLPEMCYAYAMLLK